MRVHSATSRSTALTEREVLLRRHATLTGLLAAPHGFLGQNAGALGDRLRAGWVSEARLLKRLLEETKDDDFRSTIADWQSRTAAYAARSTDGANEWTDRRGCTWQASLVLELLAELTDRIERELRSADPDESRQPIASPPGPPRARTSASGKAEHERPRPHA